MLLVALLFISLLLWCLAAWFDYDDNSLATVPTTIKEYPNYIDVMNDFGTAAMAPYYLIFYSQSGYQSFQSEQTFHWLQTMLEAAIATSALGIQSPADIVAPNIWEGHFITYNQSLEIMAPRKNATHEEALAREQYLAMLQQCTSTNTQQYGMVPLKPRGDFASSYGKTHTVYMRALEHFVTIDLEKANVTGKHGAVPADWFVGFYGPNVGTYAVLIEVMPQFRTQVLITFAVLTLVITVLFRSVFIAVRMLATMISTAAFSFGVVTFIYRSGWFVTNPHSPFRASGVLLLGHPGAFFLYCVCCVTGLRCVPHGTNHSATKGTRVHERRHHVCRGGSREVRARHIVGWLHHVRGVRGPDVGQHCDDAAVRNDHCPRCAL